MLAAASTTRGPSDDRGERHQHALGVFQGQPAVDRRTEVQQVGRRGSVDGDQPGHADQHQFAVSEVSAGHGCRGHIGEGVEQRSVFGHGDGPLDGWSRVGFAPGRLVSLAPRAVLGHRRGQPRRCGAELGQRHDDRRRLLREVVGAQTSRPRSATRRTLTSPWPRAGCRAADAEACAASRLVFTLAIAACNAGTPSCNGFTWVRAASEAFKRRDVRAASRTRRCSPPHRCSDWACCCHRTRPALRRGQGNHHPHGRPRTRTHGATSQPEYGCVCAVRRRRPRSGLVGLSVTPDGTHGIVRRGFHLGETAGWLLGYGAAAGAATGSSVGGDVGRRRTQASASSAKSARKASPARRAPSWASE